MSHENKIKTGTNIDVRIDMLAFSEEKVCTYITDHYEGSAVNPPQTIEPLLQLRGEIITIDVSQTTTFAEFDKKLKSLIWKDIPDFYICCNLPCFMCGRRRYKILDPNASFMIAVNKYLNKDNTGIIDVIYLIDENAGQIWSENNLRFYVNSKERGKHNIPHVHVDDINSNKSASISIIDGERLAGELNKKDLKKAKQIIRENQLLFAESWNAKTDGITIDINHELGLIGY